MTIQNCTTCKHALDENQRPFGSASSRAYCGRKMDPTTNQPIPCEGERFAAPDADTCGDAGTFWERA